MFLLITSFLAGIITVLTPCVLPLLPVVLGSSIQTKNRSRPYIITISLTLSVIIFTLLLKATSTFFFISEDVWRFFSAVIIIGLGITILFPDLWTWISVKIGLEKSSSSFINKVGKREDFIGSVLTGVALGPIFSSCSPTYAYVVFTVLPKNFFEGFTNLIAYSIGLGLIMLLVSIFGQSLITKLKWAINPNGIFRKILGIIFIALGVLILFKIDKIIQTTILESTFIEPFDFTKVDQNILDNALK